MPMKWLCSRSCNDTTGAPHGIISHADGGRSFVDHACWLLAATMVALPQLAVLSSATSDRPADFRRLTLPARQ